MEISLCLLLFLCSTLMEAQCLECYVCDNCPKVKLDEIQTCGPTITVGSSTITPLTTESSTTARVTANIPNISTSTTSKPTSNLMTTMSEATTTSLIITTEATTTSAKSTGAITSTTEIGSNSTESDITPITTLSTATMAPTYSSMTFMENPMNTSVNIQISPSTSTSMVTETSTEPSSIAAPSTTTTIIAVNSTTSSTELPGTLLTAAPSITTTVTESASSITESAELTGALTEVSGPVFSSLTTSATEPSSPDTDFISTTTTTTEVHLAIYTTESTTPNVPASSNPLMANKPLATITPETGPDKPFVSAANYHVTAVGVARPGKEINRANNFRAKTSSSEDCACKGETTCDCAATRQRTKRYALRGLGLSKADVKYVCVIDKYQVNGTEFVKRGCAIKDEDEKTSCLRSGFGNECKTCDTNQCNTATIIQSSILLIFSVYLFNC